MAVRLENAPEFRPGPRQKYPWEEWMDGSVWSVQQGEDFDTEPAAFRRGLYMTARRRGLAVSTRTDGDSVVFQFRDVT